MTIADRFPEIVDDRPNVYDDADSRRMVYEQLERHRSIGTLVTSRAAEQDGAVVTWHGTYTAIAEKSGRRVLLRGHMCTDTAVGGQIVRDKFLTKQLLQQAGVATPRGGLAHTPREAANIQDQIGSAVVVKPRFGGQGKGVTVNVESSDEVEEAFLSIENRKKGVIVEEFIDGVEFRLLATPQQCFGAVRRLLPHVMGDGASSIQELIEQKNELRKQNPNNCRLLIPTDRSTERHLARSGLALTSVLPVGERVIVRNVGGISGGGDASECLDLLEPDVLKLAQDAMAAVPTMEWGGADILLSRETGKPVLLELNTNAAISNSTFPVYGRAKDVGVVAWNHMFAQAEREPSGYHIASPLAETERVEDILRAEVLDGSRFRHNLVPVLDAYLAKQGWTVDRMSDRLSRVHCAGKGDKWFNGLMDDRFHARVSSLLRRHHTVRSILRDVGVPVPRASTIAAVEEFEGNGEAGSLTFVPREGGWAARDRYASGETPRADAKYTLVQYTRPGNHLRVYATRDRCLAVLSDSSEFVPTTEQTVEICTRAIDAVRAIPGLPWSGVDIFVPGASRAKILVEGISVQRNMTGFDFLCAGTLDAALKCISGT